MVVAVRNGFGTATYALALEEEVCDMAAKVPTVRYAGSPTAGRKGPKLPRRVLLAPRAGRSALLTALQRS